MTGRMVWRAGRASLWAIAVAAMVVLCGLMLQSARAAQMQTLEIVSKSGVHVFSVEMATSDKEREIGLMFRKSLPDGQGMLFDFTPEQNVTMWMKNTYIPLDMVFIARDGTIVRIAADTVPLSLDIVSSGGTLIACARALAAAGAARVDAVVTHALFPETLVAEFARAGIRTIRSTDSVPHPTNAIALDGVLAEALRTELHATPGQPS